MQSSLYIKHFELRKQMGAKWQPEAVWVKWCGGDAPGPVSRGTAMGRPSTDLPWSGDQRSPLRGKTFSRRYIQSILVIHMESVSLWGTAPQFLLWMSQGQHFLVGCAWSFQGKKPLKASIKGFSGQEWGWTRLDW